jgi:hypothetical protein
MAERARVRSMSVTRLIPHRGTVALGQRCGVRDNRLTGVDGGG